MAANPAVFFAKLDAIAAAHEKAGGKVVRSPEELRELVAEEERRRAQSSALVLKDEPPSKT